MNESDNDRCLLIINAVGVAEERLGLTSDGEAAKAPFLLQRARLAYGGLLGDDDWI